MRMKVDLPEAQRLPSPLLCMTTQTGLARLPDQPAPSWLIWGVLGIKSHTEFILMMAMFTVSSVDLPCREFPVFSFLNILVTPCVRGPGPFWCGGRGWLELSVDVGRGPVWAFVFQMRRRTRPGCLASRRSFMDWRGGLVYRLWSAWGISRRGRVVNWQVNSSLICPYVWVGLWTRACQCCTYYYNFIN